MKSDLNINRRKLLLTGGAVSAAAALSVFPAPFVRAQSTRTLTFWHGFTEGARADFMVKVSKKFEAANPGVTVKIETVPWASYAQKWPAAMAGGTLPDVAILLAEEAVPMYLSGALNTTNDLVTDLGGEAAFTPGLVAANSKFKGDLISVPYYVHNRLMIYRKDRFEEAGAKPPVTWDDAFNGAVATTKAPDHYGWVLKLAKGDVGGGYLLWMLARSAGASFYDADGKVTLTDASVKEAVRYVVELAKAAGGPGVLQYKISDNFSLLNSGKTSMVENSAAQVAFAAQQAPDLAAKLAGSFMPKKTQVGNLMGSISVTLPKGQNSQDAKSFAAFLFNEENYLSFIHSVPLFMFPTLQKASGSAFLANPVVQQLKEFSDLTLEGLKTASLAGMEHGLNAYGAPVFNAQIIEEMFQRILADGTSIDDALGMAAKRMEKTITDVRRRLE